MTKDVTTVGAVIFLCAIVGIVMAMIVEKMCTDGIIIPELITGTITIGQLMFLIVFLWIIVGIIVGTNI